MAFAEKCLPVPTRRDSQVCLLGDAAGPAATTASRTSSLGHRDHRLRDNTRHVTLRNWAFDGDRVVRIRLGTVQLT